MIAVPSRHAASSRSGSALFALREAGLWLLLYPLYLLTREGATGTHSAALRHAHEIVAVERSLGFAIEGALSGSRALRR